MILKQRRKQRKKLMEMRKNSKRKKIRKTERTAMGKGKLASMYGQPLLGGHPV